MKVDGLSLSLGGSCLLEDISFSVNRGESVALIGANGAGKTTLLKCLLGLLSPDSGSVMIRDREMRKMSRVELAREMAYVPQLLEVSVPFSVLDFVVMSRYAHDGGVGFGDDREGEDVALAMLERVGMLAFSHRTMNTLSGGERQKVCVAAALAQMAPVLILDEPSAHLDPRQSEEIYQILVDIAREDGLTVLAVTHDLNWAGAHFDRIIGMKMGKIVCDGTPESVINQVSLREVFGVDFTMFSHPESGRPMVLPASVGHLGKEGGTC